MRRAIQQGAALLALAVFCAMLASASRVSTAAAQDVRGPIYTAEAHGTMTSVTTGYLERALQTAESANATALIITVSSEGGVLRDVRPLAADIAQSTVPVVVYLAPEGTDAGAPGALLLSAAQISAMAPRTSFGSPYPLAQLDAALSQQSRSLVLGSVADQLRAWNNAQGRNVAWIDRAVGDGALLTNEQASALQPPAVDIVASSQEELLTLLEGRTVTLGSGRSAPLSTLGRSTIDIAPTLWESVRLALAEPTLAFALLVLGAVAIYLEFAAPGTSLFVGIGLVLIAGAATGLAVLPLQWWGLALVIFSLALVGAEFFVTAHGGLAAAGLITMVIGAINLIDPIQAPGASIAGWAVVLVAVALGGLAALGVWLAVRTRTQPAVTGQAAMVGRLAEVRSRIDPDGMVFIEGALWQAVSENGAAEPGEFVQIVQVHNLRLVVRRIEPAEHNTVSETNVLST